MKILLFGKDGQLGRRLEADLPAVGEVVALGHLECDISDAGAVAGAAAGANADVFINAAAYTAVDEAENDDRRCFEVNAAGPLNLAEAAERCGAALIHYSTDYVFDGNKDTPYLEADRPHPASVYGRSKLAGENHVAQMAGAHLILRVGWLYSEDANSFMGKILIQFAEKDTVSVVDDQTGTPTSAEFVCRATCNILRQSKGNVSDYLRKRSGIVHLSCGGQATWFEFAEALLALAKKADMAITTRRLTPVSAASLGRKANRPSYSCLGGNMAKQRFEIQAPDWQDELRRLFDKVFYRPAGEQTVR